MLQQHGFGLRKALPPATNIASGASGVFACHGLHRSDGICRAWSLMRMSGTLVLLAFVSVPAVLKSQDGPLGPSARKRAVEQADSCSQG